MENGDIITLSSKAKDKDQSGHSEEKLDKDTELQAGQWLDLKTKTSSRPFKHPHKQSSPIKSVQMSSSQRLSILFDYQKSLRQEIGEKIDQYTKDLQEDKDSTKLLDQILNLQSKLNGVLKALKWEKKGQLDISKLPKEVQNLLK